MEDDTTARAVVGWNIERARNRFKMSAIDLAEAAGITRQYLYVIEAGEANFTIELIERIAEALGMEARELFLMQPDFPTVEPCQPTA